MGIDDTTIRDMAARHGFDEDAGRALLEALRRGGGTMAQFDHPALGGFGQWSRGGMLMIGDMNNHALKARVDALATDLAGALGHADASAAHSDRSPSPSPSPSRSPWARGEEAEGGRSTGGADWWPGDLGSPSASGAQNGVRYAVFAGARRLAVERDGRVELRDTGDHRIGGVSQSQGGTTALRFTSQHGDVDLESLPRV